MTHEDGLVQRLVVVVEGEAEDDVAALNLETWVVSFAFLLLFPSRVCSSHLSLLARAALASLFPEPDLRGIAGEVQRRPAVWSSPGPR